MSRIRKQNFFLPTRASAIIAAIGSLVFCLTFSSAAEKNEQTVFSVGYRIMDIPLQKDERGEKTLTIAVWYPTAEIPASFTYGGPTRGNVAVNARVLQSGKPYPLLVFSHGFGGGGIGSVFLTEALAARGWIAAAPDHHDSYSAVRIRQGAVPFDRRGFLHDANEITKSGPGERGKYHYRIREIRTVLDYMLTAEDFRGFVDPEKLAVGGHSLGGFAALGVCGTLPEEQDARVKAVLLYSTGASGYLYTPEELHRIKIPLMLFMGEREKRQKRGEKTMIEISESIYSAAAGPKYFLIVRDGTHFSFNNRFSDGLISGWLGGTGEQFDVIREYSVAFLQKYTVGDQNAAPVLDRQRSLITRYLKSP